MTLRIGELAALTGEQVRTLRFWTDRGLLDATRANNTYRVYTPDAQHRVAFIRSAQVLGLSLGIIARLLDLAQRERRPCTQVIAELDAQREAVRQRIAALMVVEQPLSGRLREAQQQPCDDSGCRYLPPA